MTMMMIVMKVTGMCWVSLTASHGTLGVAGDGDVSGRTGTSTVDAQCPALAVNRSSTAQFVDVPCSKHDQSHCSCTTSAV